MATLSGSLFKVRGCDAFQPDSFDMPRTADGGPRALRNTAHVDYLRGLVFTDVADGLKRLDGSDARDEVMNALALDVGILAGMTFDLLYASAREFKAERRSAIVDAAVVQDRMQRLGRQVEEHVLLQNQGLDSRVDVVVPQGMDAQDEADCPDSGSELDAEEEALGVSPSDSDEEGEGGSDHLQ